jgi:hypothetical protein
LNSNTTGYQNTASGLYSLYSNTTGYENTAFGYDTLTSNASGIGNIALGVGAGNNISSGNYNIIIGYDIDAPSAAGDNQMSIGNLIFGTGIDGTGTTISSGNIGIGDAGPDYRLEVLDTVTQFTITNTDNVDYVEFFTDGNGDLTIDSSGDINIAPSGGNSNIYGSVTINGAFTFPTVDGASTQTLQTDGAGTLSWASAGASNAISQLDSNVTVTDAGSGNIAFTVDGSEIARIVGSNFGISDTTPDYKLEVLATATQLALTNTDTVDWAEFWVDANGDLRIEPSGGDIIVPSGTTIGAVEEGDIQFFDGDTAGENYEVEIYGYITATTGATFTAMSLDDTNDEFLIDVADGDGSTTLDLAFQLDDASGSSVFRIRDDTGTEVFYVDSDGYATMAGSTAQTLVTRVKAGAASESDADGALVVDSSNSRIYARFGGSWYYVAIAAGFQIPDFETTDPISGEPIEVGDFVLGTINETMSDGALHGLWTKFDNVKDQLFGDLFDELAATDILATTSESTPELFELDEEGNVIDVVTGSDEPIAEPTLFSRFVESVRKALASLGLFIENGVASIKGIVTDRLTTKVARIEMMEMVDSATGEVYCTWIANGRWEKVLGECDSIDPNAKTKGGGNAGPGSSGGGNTKSETPILETTTSSTEPVLEQCDNSHLGLCDTQEKCETISLYWYGDQCHLNPEAIITPIPEPEPEPIPEPEPVLDTTTPSDEPIL